MKFMESQRIDAHCDQVRQYIGLPKTPFTYNKNGVLVRKAPIDGTIQKVVPSPLRTRILKTTHYSLLVSHLDERRMYDTLRREFYWCPMVSDVYTVASNCIDCPETANKCNHQRKLEVFPPAGPPNLVAIEIFGPLLKTEAGN